ncbi:MAG: hypothetical protein ABI614_10755 [Planctomycetota bacterium]
MTALLIAIACLTAAPEEQSRDKLREQELLEVLVAKKARWDERTGTLKITGAGDFSRQDLLAISKLPRLRSLDIAYTLTDGDLAPLRDCRQIETIALRGDHFTDEAMPHLAAIASLKVLELENCQLTAIGIAALSKMDALERSSLIQVRLPRQAVAELRSVRSLKMLSMRDTSFVSGLSGCRRLEVLNLTGVDRAKLSADEIVTELGDLKQLQRLTLSVVEESILPPSAASWFSIDFASASFVATRHYSIFDQLSTLLPKTEVSVRFENEFITFQGRNTQSGIRLR